MLGKLDIRAREKYEALVNSLFLIRFSCDK